METQDQQSLPTAIPFVLHAKELSVMASFLVVLLGSITLTLYVLMAWAFHFQHNVPVREQPNSSLFVLVMPIAIIIVGIIAKYFWLLILSPFATMAEVSPWIAYGLPRRIHALDRAFLRRFYRR